MFDAERAAREWLTAAEESKGYAPLLRRTDIDSLSALLRRACGEAWQDGFRDGLHCPKEGKTANPYTAEIVGREVGTSWVRHKKKGKETE